MDLTDNEKRDLVRLIENNQPIPEKYRFKLFEKKDEIELLWNGKSYDITSVSLPFQTIEHIEEPRQEKKVAQGNLFDKKQRDWTNKLIWGNNSLILSSLINGPLRDKIEKEGGLKLVYIDPPFDVGDDFEFDVEIGKNSIHKKRNALEQLAFSDTWGKQEDSFLSMLYERIKLIYSLLSPDGNFFIHCDWRTSSLIRIVLDEIFDVKNFKNQIIWEKTSTGNKAISKYQLPRVYDSIFFYSKKRDTTINLQYENYSKDYIDYNFQYEDGRGKFRRQILGTRGAESIKQLEKENRILVTKSGKKYFKQYLSESKGLPLTDFWTATKTPDLRRQGGMTKENLNYPTQKPEVLIEKIIKMGSNEGELIADFFCGSGTTLSVAEKLNRKWIGCDLGKFAIHTTRKRMIQVQRDKKEGGQDYRAFEVLNLGKYQREFFIKDYLFENRKLKKEGSEEHYYSMILEAYKGKKIENMNILRGVKNNRFIAIGPFNLQVSRLFAEKVIEECISKKITKVDILGFEFEMGLFPSIRDFAKSKNVDLNCLLIPSEVFDKSAVRKNQVIFYNTAYIDVELVYKKNEFSVKLKGYSIFDSENLFEEALEGLENGGKRELIMSNSVIKIEKDKNGKISKDVIKMKWTDWMDYWSVDFDFESKQEIIINKNKQEEWTGDYIFENEWQDFRTTKKDIDFKSRTEKIDKNKKIAVKVVDIFGNDTMKILNH